MSDMIDLLPCPFCGDCRQAVASGWLRGYAEEMHTDKDVWGWSVRHHCGSQGPEHPTEAEAIAAWNTRAALPPAPDAVDGDAALHIETALAMAKVQDGYARKATGEGERIIFKANAKAQRQIAAYIKRMAAQSAAQIIAHDTTVRPMEWEESVKGRWIGTPPVKLGDLAFWIFQSEKGYIRHIPRQGAVVYPTLDAAKAAAQADYERRIIAALDTPAPAMMAELVEALRLADAALSGANMDMRAVEKKVRAVLAKIGGAA